MEDKINIIAISGKQYSGKDTAAQVLLKYLPMYSRIGIGDAIKAKLAEIKQISIDEIYKNKHLYREELINLGNKGRSQSPDYWLNYLLGYNNIIVPDLRVAYELDFFKKKGAILIRVEADNSVRSKRGIIVKENDTTETALDSYNNWDFIIENNTNLEDLDKKIKPIADFILHRSC